MKKIIVAIDGYSGTGKSTTARAVAGVLKYRYIDTGAMYRAVTLYFIENTVDPEDALAVQKAINEIQIDFVYDPAYEKSVVTLNGRVVESQIREMEVSSQVSRVAAIKVVREAMVKKQRTIGKEGGVVMDGRDIGSVVFPQAELKVFMKTNLEVRTERRYQELLNSGERVSREAVRENLISRDELDMKRTESPLIQPPDAIVVDTTELSIEEQIDIIVEYATAIIFTEKEGSHEG